VDTGVVQRRLSVSVKTSSAIDRRMLARNLVCRHVFSLPCALPRCRLCELRKHPVALLSDGQAPASFRHLHSPRTSPRVQRTLFLNMAAECGARIAWKKHSTLCFYFQVFLCLPGRVSRGPRRKRTSFPVLKITCSRGNSFLFQDFRNDSVTELHYNVT
jgi:hypothetical protein